ncbi:phosphotransferase family protein [Nonomuraea sp. H19]|uniref:phosphotransferase family protein n=1 Tax=Nonomuraea sp. H19 TaxID=3452206 RepID=UPI003F8C5D3F
MTLDAERRFVAPEELNDLVREVFGTERGLVGVERLRGGTKKGVYRLSLDDGLGAVLYVWGQDEDFWPAGSHGEAEDPFGHASGLDLFEAAHAHLSSLGVRVPRVHFADRSGTHYPADIAMVQDVRGGTLEALLRDDPARGERVMDRLAVALEAMSRRRRRHLGKVASEGVQGRSAVEVVLGRALKDLAEAAERVASIGEVRDGFERALKEMAAVVEPRDDHGLIHGELGPDHVLVDEEDEPVLIDIEGTMFFDVEWEHVFLWIRFRERYGRLRVEGLDERRMRLYRLAQHLSLVAGPLRLLDGDFPHRETMLAIAKGHTEEALGFLRDYR